MKMMSRLRNSIQSLHVLGLALGVLNFAASLTPSLLPRPPLIQGILSGIALSLGYGLGVVCVWIWNYLQLPVAPAKYSQIVNRVAIALSSLAIAISVWRAARWQNSIRSLMGLDELASVQPFQLFAAGIAVFIALLFVSRVFQQLFQFSSLKLERFFKPRAARLFGLIGCLWLFWAISEGIVSRLVFRTVDRSFQRLDALIDDKLPVPTNSAQTGSQDSLISWETLGNQGRRFVSEGPSSSDLTQFFETPCPSPVRVYVGLNSADTAEQRAALALRELIRARGFERSTLLIVTPTGTGWVDPASQNTVEYLHRGDIATVSVQYSYLNSPLALLTDADYGRHTAEVLFDTIYDYWRALPKATRPRLFLHGLSLGSFNSDLSFDLFDIVDDPIDGALWSGPPFLHRTWRQSTAQRDVGSRYWLPSIRQGRVIRFMNQAGDFLEGEPAWGAFRIGFLQNASDPITFFDPNSAWRKPEWMDDPRGPEVSPELRWFPVVTMLQLATDMFVGTAPPGYGHNYSPNDYIRAWVGLTEPSNWSQQDLEKLHQFFEKSTAVSEGAP